MKFIKLYNINFKKRQHFAEHRAGALGEPPAHNPYSKINAQARAPSTKKSFRFDKPGQLTRQLASQPANQLTNYPANQAI